MRALRILVPAALASGLLLSGCAGDPTTTDASDAPESDGEVTLYAGRDEALIAPLIARFTDETGIAVDVRYAGTSELTALVLEEGERSPADVFLSQDAGALGALADAGLTTPIPAELAETIPDGFTSQDDSWIGVTGRARVIAYDGDVLDAAQVPTSVLELVEPEWAGRVGFPPGNASFQSFVTALRVLEGEQPAEDWAAGMAANDPVLTESNGATLDLVNAGELDLALINHYYWYQRAAELGEDAMRAQLAFLPGDPGGIVNVTGAAILTAGVDDPDALALVEYLVSPAAQQYFVEETFEYPLLPGVDAPAGLPALETLVNPGLDLSDLDSVAETQEMLVRVGLL
ncbi:extracellular solute-binding protein [Microbacter sp. GSS18]|nr:extracellular solute-binding protein [Microbacter sp. GSS18]